jgi:hypothetical protein
MAVRVEGDRDAGVAAVGYGTAVPNFLCNEIAMLRDRIARGPR